MYSLFYRPHQTHVLFHYNELYQMKSTIKRHTSHNLADDLLHKPTHPPNEIHIYLKTTHNQSLSPASALAYIPDLDMKTIGFSMMLFCWHISKKVLSPSGLNIPTSGQQSDYPPKPQQQYTLRLEPVL